MNDQRTTAVVANPFGNTQVVSAPTSSFGSTDIQRAMAEVQAHMAVARAMPRDPARAAAQLLIDCQRIGLAEDATYEYSRGGNKIAGPSIRLMEAAALRWGNMRSGIEEVSRGSGFSDCRAYAWDLESGYYDERKFQVKHWRDTQKGGYLLTDERDIYELIANMGQRRKRAVLQAIIPTDVIDAAVRQCEETLKAKADTSPDGIKRLLEAFEPFGVTKAHVEQRIQRAIDTISPAQVVGLKRVYASLRDGMGRVEDFFKPIETNAAGPTPAPTPSPTDVPARTEGQAAAQAPAPAAPSGKAAAMRQKVKDKAGVAQTEEQPPKDSEVRASGGDAGSTPAAGAPDPEVVRLQLVDWISALEGAGTPEEVQDILARAEKALPAGPMAELRKLADQAGG